MKMHEIVDVVRERPEERDETYDSKLKLYIVTMDRLEGSPYTKFKRELSNIGERIDAIHQVSFLLTKKKASEVRNLIKDIDFPDGNAIRNIFVGKISVGWAFKLTRKAERTALSKALKRVGLKYL